MPLIIINSSCTQLIENHSNSFVLRLNKGKPLDLKLLQSNHSKVSLKNHVRAGVLPNARRSYWRVCLRIKDEDVVVYSKALGHSEQGR